MARSIVICLVSICIAYWLTRHFTSNKLDALLRASVSLYSPDSEKKKVFVLNYKSHDFTGFIDSLLRRGPKHIILDFQLDARDTKAVSSKTNVIFPREDDELVYESAGVLSFGVDKRSSYVKRIMALLEIEDVGNHDFALIRFKHSEADFNFVTSETELTGATVVVGEPFSYEQDYVVQTPIGAIPNTLLIANLVSSFLTYGVERSSFLFDLCVVILLFGIHWLMNDRLSRLKAPFIFLFFVCELMLSVAILGVAFAEINIWISPWGAIAAVLLNYVDIVIRKYATQKEQPL